MPSNKLSKIILKHWNKIKFAWIFLSIIVMIIAIRTYINYNTIIEAIQKVKYDIKMVEDEIAYSNNFLTHYLDSEYSDYFLAHKSNILFNWEFIIRFQSPSQEEEKNNNNTWNMNTIQTPQEARKHFIRSKINKK